MADPVPQCVVDQADNVRQGNNGAQLCEESEVKGQSLEQCDTSKNNNIKEWDLDEDNVHVTDAAGKLQDKVDIVDNVMQDDINEANNMQQCGVYEANNIQECDVGDLNNAQSGDLNEENNKKHISKLKVVSTMCFFKDENTKKITDAQKQKKSNTNNLEGSVKSHMVPSSMLLHVDSEVTDNENAEWDSVKNLTSDEQRYEHVRKCWGTRKVPNPNKDLTFCSFMKKRLLLKNEDSVLAKYRKQRKRVATHSPCERKSKRQKTSVDYFNKKMDLVTEQSMKEKVSVRAIFDQQMDANRWNCFHEMSDFYNQPYFMNETWRIQEIEMMWVHEQNSLHHDCDKHLAWINRKEAADIRTLKNIKNEVLKFNKFYQGLDVGEDLTVLTNKQYQELKEIDEMYDAYKKCYN